MTELLTAAQMRAIEQAAIASGEVTGLELMERAGRGVVEAIFEEWPEPATFENADEGQPPNARGIASQKERAVVLCGPGNNGGDGFVVARLLQECGWDVQVFLYGDAEKLPPDARVNYERWRELGDIRAISECYSGLWLDQPLVVDAIFGVGLSRQIPNEVRNVLMATANCRRVAVDVPSMLDGDSGKMRTAVWESIPAANLTVSFHAPKIGHYVGEGAFHCGKIVIKEIGLENRTVQRIMGSVHGGQDSRSEELAAVTLALDWVPHTSSSMQRVGVLDKDGDAHKYSHGHALILSGGVGKGGAARLAARGALRIGAGAVTVGCPPAALIENAAQLNAIMLSRVDGGSAFETMLDDPRINVLCLGPGMGVIDESRDLIAVALRSGRGLVLDADALTLLAGDPDLFSLLHENCVLTPHAGEFARLFPDIAEKLNAPAVNGPAYSKVDATREAAARAGCVVLFKGPDTVIAAPSGHCIINASVYERAAPWLATAGSGDVLAGFIAGLLARGFGPMQAAETGAWLHTACALSFGPGLIAEDLPEELPKVLRDMKI